jgi:hypothetical protein
MWHPSRAAWLAPLRRLAEGQSGAIAIETVLLVPVLLVLLAGTVDIAWLVIAKQRASRVAATVADLTARVGEVYDADIADILAAVSNVAAPFTVADGDVVITSVANIDGMGAQVVWQEPPGATSAVGSPGDVPATEDELALQEGENVIVGEVRLRARPILGLVVGEIDVYERIYQRARYGVVERMSD